jgi:hypothetical protein
LVVQSGYHVPHEQFIGLVIHHTVVGYWGDPIAYMRRLQTSRPDLTLEVPYSFIVMPGATDEDAIIGFGRGWERTGAHTIGYNSTRYGVAFAGDFTEVAPTSGMLAAVREIGSQLADPINAVWTLGHRDTGYATACPGVCTMPHMEELQPPFVVPLVVQSIQSPATPIEEDMQLSDKTTEGHSVNDLLEWTIAGVNKINARLDVIEQALAKGGTTVTADQIRAAIKEKL